MRGSDTLAPRAAQMLRAIRPIVRFSANNRMAVGGRRAGLGTGVQPCRCPRRVAIIGAEASSQRRAATCFTTTPAEAP